MLYSYYAQDVRIYLMAYDLKAHARHGGDPKINLSIKDDLHLLYIGCELI